MGSILHDGAGLEPHRNLDVPMRQAKVHGPARNHRDGPANQAKVHTTSHKKVAIAESRVEKARWIDRARALSRLTADQFAAAVGCHPSQLSKWISNAEPPQLDRVLMSPMRGFLLQAIAEETPGCVVQTTIAFVRSA